MRRRVVAFGVMYLVAGVAAGALLSFIIRSAHTATSGGGSANNAAVTAVAPFAKQAAPPFTLLDQNGAPVSLASAKGHVVLLTFMDPQCTLLCPVMGRDIGALEKKLPASIQPELLIVSVAAGRTQTDVQNFLATESPGWRPGWHWLLGPNEAALKLTWAHWHIAVIPGAGDINHDAVLNVIDPGGNLRAVYPAPLPIDDVVHAITTIAHA
ncbi:MAG TPA: SCO family protein [Candidatus Acidoferrales bacterium]|jgi:cytochrome oxidase Cu insertion factor (SCO1/SenC/PrrC family)|nr:SCO family protein [Candidatus Acidoferrales bacterium]